MTQVCQSLAQQIVRDGEGATKFIEILCKVPSRKLTPRRLRAALRTHRCSRPPWPAKTPTGAAFSAPPVTPACRFDPNRTDIHIGSLPVCENGMGLQFDESQAKQILQQHDIRISLDLKSGTASSTVWTCDLTTEYIHINADYRT